MVAVPSATAVTEPLLTVTMPELLLVQVKLLLAALLGDIVAVIVDDCPIFSVRLVGFNLILSTWIFFVTVIFVDVLTPLGAVAVIVTVPGFNAVTFPSGDTVATLVSDELNVKDLSVE